MVEKSDSFAVPPLALYIMSVARWDVSVTFLERYIKRDWFPIPPRWYQGFDKQAERFGRPDFVDGANIASFMAGFKKKDKGMGECVVNMVRELRYTMKALAKDPILVDTGQYRPKKQDRTFADMENEIAMRLTQQGNFQAKVKTLAGEHDIRTLNLYVWRTGSTLSVRIAQVKALMRAKRYCRHYLDVEREINKRQERWKNGGDGGQSAGGPPPTRL